MGEFVHVRESIHEADGSGASCYYCGVALVGPRAPSWRRGDYVALIDGDSRSAWLTPRNPTCRSTYRALLAAQEEFRSDYDELGA